MAITPSTLTPWPNRLDLLGRTRRSGKVWRPVHITHQKQFPAHVAHEWWGRKGIEAVKIIDAVAIPERDAGHASLVHLRDAQANDCSPCGPQLLVVLGKDQVGAGSIESQKVGQEVWGCKTKLHPPLERRPKAIQAGQVAGKGWRRESLLPAHHSPPDSAGNRQSLSGLSKGLITCLQIVDASLVKPFPQGTGESIVGRQGSQWP